MLRSMTITSQISMTMSWYIKCYRLMTDWTYSQTNEEAK